MCVRVCVCAHVCQEVDCCGGGDRGCRAPNEGVRNKISALGPRLRPASLKLHLIENGTAVMI